MHTYTPRHPSKQSDAQLISTACEEYFAKLGQSARQICRSQAQRKTRFPEAA